MKTYQDFSPYNALTPLPCHSGQTGNGFLKGKPFLLSALPAKLNRKQLVTPTLVNQIQTTICTI